MTTTTRVEITKTCRFEVVEYDTLKPDVSLDYIEHSSDHWHSDNETSLDIDKDKALEIVNLLSKAFDLNVKTGGISHEQKTRTN